MAYCDYLEGRVYSVTLFIEDEHAILHSSRCEEAYVTAAGQLLGCATDVVGRGRHAV